MLFLNNRLGFQYTLWSVLQVQLLLIDITLLVIVSVCVVKENLVREQEQLRQECLHLQSRLDAVQTDCQREREVREGRHHNVLPGMYGAHTVCVRPLNWTHISSHNTEVSELALKGCFS